jgi:prepilin-type N-terminal cleavage/methylation domain-containing protein
MPKGTTTERPEGQSVATLQLDDERDEGFTLLEVVVAVVLMAGVLMTAAGFITKSMTSSKNIEGRQVAVTVARQVMENVRSISPTFPSADGRRTTGGISRLVSGRSLTDVTAQWAAAAAAGIDVSKTYTGSGVTAFDADTYSLPTGASVSPVVPLTSTTTLSGQQFQIFTLIGTCGRAKGADHSASAPTSCSKTTAGDEVFRVVVRVTWVAGAGRTCSGQTCQYVLTTLIDPTVQPTFNTQRKPIAVDDPDTIPIVATSGDLARIGVVANDSGYFPITGAVAISGAPTHGSVALDAGSDDVLYTPTCGYSGMDTFKYAVTDTNSQVSNAATVTVTVLPKAANDVLTASTKSTVLNVTANDTCAPSTARVTVVTQPSSGSATPTTDGRSVTLAVAAAGTYSFTYTLTDLNGFVSAPVTAAVTVTPPAVHAVADAYTVVRNSSTNLTVLTNDVFTPPATVSIVAVSGGTATVGTSGSIDYKAPASGGPFTVDYKITDDWGLTDQARVTVTLTVPAVVAVDDTYSLKVNTVGSFDLMSNDTNSAGGTVSNVSQTAGPSNSIVASTLNADGTGTVKFLQGGTYVFAYTVTANGTSDTGQVTYTVLGPTSTWTCWNNLGKSGSKTRDLATKPDVTGSGSLTVAFTSGSNPSVSGGTTVKYNPSSSNWNDFTTTYTVKDSNGTAGPFTVTLSQATGC